MNYNKVCYCRTRIYGMLGKHTGIMTAIKAWTTRSKNCMLCTMKDCIFSED